MNLYFACTFAAQFEKILQGEAVKKRLYSFFYDYRKGYLAHKGYDSVLWDSGGFTARKSGAPISVEKFAKFLNENRIEFAFNLDMLDLNETWANQKYLESHTNTYIIPIYHIQSWLQSDLQWIDNLREYPFVSFGGMVGQKPTKVIPFLKTMYSLLGLKRIHLLGVTVPKVLKDFPAYSSDSSSWLAGGRYGVLKTNELGESVKKFVIKTQHFSKALSYDVQHYLELEKQVTQIWCARGIHFGCPHDENDWLKLRSGHELARNLIGKTETRRVEL